MAIHRVKIQDLTTIIGFLHIGCEANRQLADRILEWVKSKPTLIPKVAGLFVDLELTEQESEGLAQASESAAEFYQAQAKFHQVFADTFRDWSL